MNIEMLTRTFLEDLASQTGDSSAMSVLDTGEVVYVARASVRTLVRLEAHVGSRFPAYPTSMGRVLLAGLDERRLDRYLADTDLVALTERTVTEPGRLRELIRQCGRDGYSAVEDELAYGVVAVAVPVVDATGRVVAALNSSGHSRRIDLETIVRERVGMLQSASEQISRELARLPGLSLSAQL